MSKSLRVRLLYGLKLYCCDCTLFLLAEILTIVALFMTGLSIIYKLKYCTVSVHRGIIMSLTVP